MNALQIFEYKEKPVRMIERNGEPWWVLKDVCEALEISGNRNVAARLDEDEKADVQVSDASSNGVTQRRTVTVTNEPGLYKVILRSNKPEAKAFTRWLTHEVLPQIRRTGGYGGDLEGIKTRLDELTAQVKNLAESRPALPDGDDEYAAWCRKIFRKLDYIGMRRGETRQETLHQLYVSLQARFDFDLNEERAKCGGRSGLYALYVNTRMRKIVETVIETSVGMV